MTSPFGRRTRVVNYGCGKNGNEGEIRDPCCAEERRAINATAPCDA